MEHNDFANVAWDGQDRQDAQSVGKQNDTEGPGDDMVNDKRRGSEGQAGKHADDMDLAGVGEGVLECTVTQPIKENDGTKDAFVSYLVTTNVGNSERYSDSIR